MSIDRLAPWLERTYEAVKLSLQGDRLPHALLIDAVPGWGLYELVPYVAASVLGVDSESSIEHNLDYMSIQRQLKTRGKGKDKLKIDQVKEALDFLIATNRQSERRLVVIEEAEALTIPATQALLKILEEPPPNKHIVLFTTESALLPPTIRSRCQRFAVQCGTSKELDEFLQRQSTDVETLKTYLDDFGGAPYLALEAHRQQSFNLTETLQQFVRKRQTLVETAEQLMKEEEDPLDTLMRWQYATLRFARNATQVEPIAVFYDELSDLRRQIHEAAGLHNIRQYLRLLIKWQALIQDYQHQRR